MKEFEEIPHSGGKVTFSNGQSKWENSNPFPMVLYEIAVSFVSDPTTPSFFNKNDLQ
jgi:hypothetical protein